MKLQSTLVASLFACVQYISAQSNLIVFSQDGHRFYLLVDGVQQNNTPQSNIKINGLPHNVCKVKVVFENNTLTTIDKTIYFSPDEDLEYVYNLKPDKHNKMQLRALTQNSIASSTNNTPNQNVYVYGSTVNNNNPATASPTIKAASPNVAGSTTTTTVTTTEVRETTTGTTGGNVNVNMSGMGIDETDLSNGNTNLTISMGVGMAGAGMNVSVTETNGTSDNANMGINTTFTDPEMNDGNINMGVNMNVTDNTGYPNTWDNGNSTNTTTTTTNNNGTVTSTTVTTTSTTTTTTTTGGGSTAYPNNSGYSENYNNGSAAMAKPANNTNNCFSAMSNADYSRLQASIKSKSFSKDQVAIGKQAVQSNCLTAEQIKGIMKIMSYDDTRLEFAQLAYPTCYDKQNFYQVNDAFAFPSNVEKLNKALGL